MTKGQWMRIFAILVLLIALPTLACAEGTVSTTVVMRVSKLTQDAVVNAGEDLSIEISVSGIEPASYQWYFQDEAILGANQRVFNLVNAQTDKAGVYRMDAFDANGRMLVSMDTSVRVVDQTVPKSGDSSVPGAAAAAAMAALAGLVILSVRRRQRA